MEKSFEVRSITRTKREESSSEDGMGYRYAPDRFYEVDEDPECHGCRERPNGNRLISFYSSDASPTDWHADPRNAGSPLLSHSIEWEVPADAVYVGPGNRQRVKSGTELKLFFSHALLMVVARKLLPLGEGESVDRPMGIREEVAYFEITRPHRRHPRKRIGETRQLPMAKVREFVENLGPPIAW